MRRSTYGQGGRERRRRKEGGRRKVRDRRTEM